MSEQRGFARLPTAPVNLPTTQHGPGSGVESGAESPMQPGAEARTWDPAAAPTAAPDLDRGFAGWSLAFAIVGLVVSFFVGWGFVIGVVAIVLGIMALRHPRDSRAVAVWAIVLATLSLVYSAGWLIFAWRVLA